MRIKTVFAELLAQQKKALIPYLTAGDPTLALTKELVIAMDQAGADIIELGIPYSDPLADGVVIQRAAQRALAGGASLTKVLELVASLQGTITAPLVLLVYFNPIYQYGIKDFIEQCVAVGVGGLIIPDLPVEESAEIRKIVAAGNYPLDLIPLVAPTSRERISTVVAGATGFVYAVSSKGVTGVRKEFAADLADFLAQIKGTTSLPVALGFGIGSVETVTKVKDHVDGVIVGSALVELIEKGSSESDILANVTRFIKELKAALG